MERSLCLVDDHLVRTPDKDGDRPGVGAVLNDEHLVPRRSEADLPDDTSVTKLVSRQVLESRDDATLGSNGDKLQKERR